MNRLERMGHPRQDRGVVRRPHVADEIHDPQRRCGDGQTGRSHPTAPRRAEGDRHRQREETARLRTRGDDPQAQGGDRGCRAVAIREENAGEREENGADIRQRRHRQQRCLVVAELQREQRRRGEDGSRQAIPELGAEQHEDAQPREITDDHQRAKIDLAEEREHRPRDQSRQCDAVLVVLIEQEPEPFARRRSVLQHEDAVERAVVVVPHGGVEPEVPQEQEIEKERHADPRRQRQRAPRGTGCDGHGCSVKERRQLHRKPPNAAGLAACSRVYYRAGREGAANPFAQRPFECHVRERGKHHYAHNDGGDRSGGNHRTVGVGVRDRDPTDPVVDVYAVAHVAEEHPGRPGEQRRKKGGPRPEREHDSGERQHVREVEAVLAHEEHRIALRRPGGRVERRHR